MKAVLSSVFVVALAALALSAAPHDSDRAASKVARGKYLVENVAMCADCHSERDQKGQFIKEKWLEGQEIPFSAAVPIPNFTRIAPPIAGLSGWTDEQARKFLTTGETPDGSRANPPMPDYRFSRADADAVVAYLRSLNAPKGADLKKAHKKE